MKLAVRSSVRLLTPSLPRLTRTTNALSALSIQQLCVSQDLSASNINTTKTINTNTDVTMDANQTIVKGNANVHTPLSAVDVENFTLRQEIVQRDMDNLQKWNDLSREIDAARAAHDYKQILCEVQKGLTLLEELGPLNAPIQCETLLCMEAAQAEYNLANYTNALSFAQRAEHSLTHVNSSGVTSCEGKSNVQSKEDNINSTSKDEKSSTSTDTIDHAQLAEIRQFIGFVLCKMEKAQEALDIFTKLLHWIDVDAKQIAPMQAVAAINLRRSVLTGQAESTLLLGRNSAQVQKENISQAREYYARALDMYIDALNLHIDENDSAMVKMCLRGIMTCFEELSDICQAITTCKKYISWCDRHHDNSGVEEGQKMLSELCDRHPIATDNGDDAKKTTTSK